VAAMESQPRGIVDRDVERKQLDALVGATRAGSSGVLVLQGEPGIGKTMLLESAIDLAAGMQTLRVAGVQSELDLSYAALQQLLRPLLGETHGLAGTQAEALGAAFGNLAAVPSSSLVVAAAALALISNAAAREPVISVVDDADCLDEASAVALAFAARRLAHDPVLMLFALTEEHTASGSHFANLPIVRLAGLSHSSSRELVDQAVGGPLDSHVRERLATELGGNPLAVLEVAAELTAGELDGSIPLPATLPVSDDLTAALLQGVRRLPDDTQRLLLLVSAERSGEPGLLWRAADRLGIARSAAGPAATVLSTRTEQISFRHHLVRAGVYASATEQARRDVHLALALSLDPVIDADRAAWHRAATATGPDDGVAAELEAAAALAQRRSGYAGAGAYLERAARLTQDAQVRSRRYLRAAELELTAGNPARAAELFALVTVEELDERSRVQAKILRARLAVARGENGHTSGLLLDAADALAAFDPAGSQAMHLQALGLSLFTGRLGLPDSVERAAAAALAARRPDEPSATSHVLEGLARLYTDGPATAAPALRLGVDLSRDEGGLESLSAAYQGAWELWDDAALYGIANRRVDIARAAGALGDLPNGLSQMGTYQILAGRLDAAEACFGEADEIMAATGTTGLLGAAASGSLIVAAWRGEDARTRALVEACTADATHRGLGAFVGFAQYALAILELALGNYGAALTAAEDACIDTLLVTRTLPALIEAATRTRERKTAADALRKLDESATASGTQWGLGMLARSRALHAQDEGAEALYVEAIDHLKRCRARTQLAHTRLLYGEWLRRERRRLEARDQLRVGAAMFQAMGAQAFARRAQTELAATGARARSRTPDTVRSLTAHERRIATLAGDGATNADIAAQLFISPRTVEYHLGKVYKKLGVNSRATLTDALLEPEG
jgi:DNA-binding CsgD family transcriptional regulator